MHSALNNEQAQEVNNDTIAAEPITQNLQHFCTKVVENPPTNFVSVSTRGVGLTLASFVESHVPSAPSVESRISPSSSLNYLAPSFRSFKFKCLHKNRLHTRTIVCMPEKYIRYVNAQNTIAIIIPRASWRAELATKGLVCKVSISASWDEQKLTAAISSHFQDLFNFPTPPSFNKTLPFEYLYNLSGFKALHRPKVDQSHKWDARTVLSISKTILYITVPKEYSLRSSPMRSIVQDVAQNSEQPVRNVDPPLDTTSRMQCSAIPFETEISDNPTFRNVIQPDQTGVEQESFFLRFENHESVMQVKEEIQSQNSVHLQPTSSTMVKPLSYPQLTSEEETSESIGSSDSRGSTMKHHRKRYRATGRRDSNFEQKILNHLKAAEARSNSQMERMLAILERIADSLSTK